MEFATAILQYYRQLSPPEGLPNDVETMNPYARAETMKIVDQFYNQYYSDQNERIICFGINPGRFGAGLTGIPFTDPIRLKTICRIDHDFQPKAELSSKFIYEMIENFGGATAFYRHFFISAISPLGYIRNGINLNYYDIAGYREIFTKYAVREISKQLKMGISRKVAFSIGTGKNVDFLNRINDDHHFFDQIIALPHPRWVMQYRLKRKDEFILEYLEKLKGFL